MVDSSGRRIWIGNGGDQARSASCCRVLQWNILATGVTQKQNVPQLLDHGWDSEAAERVCDWATRRPLIVDQVVELQPEIITFQEIDCKMWRDLSADLTALGFAGEHTHYPHGWLQQDYGLAIFWHKASGWRQVCKGDELLRTLSECEGVAEIVNGVEQQHRALAVALERSSDDWRVAVVTAHPTWQGPEAIRVAQLSGALSVATRTAETAGWAKNHFDLLLCGDLNTTPDRISHLAAQDEGPVTFQFLTEEKGLLDVYTSFPGAFRGAVSRFTHGIEGITNEILDFILHSSGLRPVAVLQIDRDSVLQGQPLLPRVGYPSDHVHLACDLQRKEPPQLALHTSP